MQATTLNNMGLHSINRVEVHAAMCARCSARHDISTFIEVQTLQVMRLLEMLAQQGAVREELHAYVASEPHQLLIFDTGFIQSSSMKEHDSKLNKDRASVIAKQ